MSEKHPPPRGKTETRLRLKLRLPPVCYLMECTRWRSRRAREAKRAKRKSASPRKAYYTTVARVSRRPAVLIYLSVNSVLSLCKLYVLKFAKKARRTVLNCVSLLLCSTCTRLWDMPS